jgi:hypothetical protein
MQTIQQFPSWFSKQKLSGKVAIGFASLFLLCCLCSVPMAILSPSEPTSEVVSTPIDVSLTDMDVSSIQTAAVNTAVAGINQTATANIPTSTSSPIPTLTLEATLTPQPIPDTYEISIGEKVPAYVEAFFDVNEYVQQVSNDTSLLFDNDWKTNLGLSLGILNFRAEEMAKLEPTPKYVNLHSIIVHIADETYLFTDAYANGVDNFDSALIDKAIQHLISMTTLMQDATTEMDKINATP